MYYFGYSTLNCTKFVEGITLFDTNGLFLRFFGIYTLMETHHGKAELFLHCQCCMRGVALTAGSGTADFFWNNNTTKVVNSANDAGSTPRALPSGAFIYICLLILQFTQLVSVNGRRLYLPAKLLNISLSSL